MFGIPTRAALKAQIKTQAVTIGELSDLTAKQALEIASMRTNRRVTEGIFNARIAELQAELRQAWVRNARGHLVRHALNVAATEGEKVNV